VSAPPPKTVERVVDRVVERVVVRDTSGAPATLACLRCGQSMQTTPVEDASVSPVSQCHSCGGAWVPVDTADFIKRKGTDELRRQIAIGEMLALVKPRRDALACPVCSAPMEQLGMAETVHDVDVCRAHGTWFDRTELAAFIQREKRRRESDDE
jgi:Zn-finger nucleic acid-binding protein